VKCSGDALTARIHKSSSLAIGMLTIAFAWKEQRVYRHAGCSFCL